MSKFTLRDAQTAISGLADGQAALLAAIQNLAQQNGSHPLSNAVSANLVAPVGQPIITRDERHRADVTASVQQANANGHLNLDDVTIDNENRQIPEDNPHKEGPCWATNVLQSKNGLFPGMKRKKNPKSSTLEIVRYDVSPANRSHFMANAAGRQFGLTVSLTVPDGKGGEKTAQFPALCSLAAKQFSSYDHGLYGRIESVDVVLPDGSEFTLSGQVNMQLKKRKA